MTLDLPRSQRDDASPVSPATLIAGPVSTVPVTVTPLTDHPSGARVASMPTSGLIAGIAPIHDVGRLTALPSFKAAAYACISQGSLAVPGVHLRPGESLHNPRRQAEHQVLPPCPVEEVLLVGPANPTFGFFGRDETRALEWLLHRLAVEAGRAAVHGTAPPRPALLDREPQRLARWASDAMPLFRALGTPAFAPPGPVLRPIAVEPDDATFRAVQRGYATELPPGLTEQPDARLYELAWAGIYAMATVSGSWTVLHAGSMAAADLSSGVQSCIADKRRAMLAEGIFQRGASGLWRVTRDVALPSLLNALRVLTGTNELDHYWRRA